jgi:hypothetical protein
MDNAQIIRQSIDQVFALRADAGRDGRLALAVAGIKRLQAARFQAHYSDLLASKVFGAASRFFLEELYGVADYSDRDMQFARIAGTLAAVFPSSVVGTAVALAQLHALTEELDHQMALAWLTLPSNGSSSESERYVLAWHAVGRRADRFRQLEVVLSIGRRLGELTGKPGVSMMLKLMRRPAASAGMASMQQFLERGFGIFATMARSKDSVSEFLTSIESREAVWLEHMFDDLPSRSAEELAKLLVKP